jgi:hypothetical protein
MRAISPIANYGITLKRPRVRRGVDQTGTILEVNEGDTLHAQFQRGGLTEWEQVVAIESFDFSGLPDGVNPLTRVSVFDTEAYVESMIDYSEKEKAAILEEIDTKLRKLSQTFPSEFLIVEKPPAPRPWPTYDDTPFEDAVDRETGDVLIPGIKTMQGMTGIEPETIRLYEHENAQRPEVIEWAESLEAEKAASQAGEFSVSL